jgi:2-polyprenyl-6-methoxyphenol hydroxylase-like FAD-dependent oxidoreductase
VILHPSSERKNVKPSPSSSLHVIVIGAGLGGLCLAQGLKQNGISVAVYEKDASPFSRTQGYRIRIDHHGRDALQACLPPDRFRLFSATCAQAAAGVDTVNGQLQPLAGKWVSSWRKSAIDGGAPDSLADRQTMRQVLMQGLRREVHFGAQFLHYEETADGRVTAHFVNGGSATGDLLVAADGVRSAVAAQRFPAMQPQDTGDVCVYGKTPLTAALRATLAHQLQAGTSVIFEKGLAGVIDAMRFGDEDFDDGLPQPDDYLYWALVGARERFGLEQGADAALRLSAAELTQKIGAVTVGWSPALKLVYESCNPAMRTLVPIRTASLPRLWKASRVTALGDAIHAMSPAGGLGANSALADAALLTRALVEAQREAGGVEKVDTITPAIDLYESLMCARSFAALESSQQGNRQLLGRDENAVTD